MKINFRTLTFALWVSGLLTCSCALSFAGTRGVADNWRTYLEGLDRMKEGKWDEAVAALDRAINAGGRDTTMILALGVANTLAGRFDDAFRDLAQVGKREAEVWTYAAEAMSGKVKSGHGIPIPRNLQKQYGEYSQAVSIPGNLIQGGKDYSTDYASFVFYEMARPYEAARKAGRLQKTAEVREAMLKAGRWFANRAMAKPELAGLHLERAKILQQQNRHREALEELTFAQTVYPGDPSLSFYTAESWRALGRMVTARREYTRALILKTNYGHAYLGRAQAAAGMGDEKRALADLKIAAQYGLEVGQGEKAIKEDLARYRVTDPPDKLFVPLEKSALTGKDIEALVPMALALERSWRSKALDYGEIFQARLWELEEACRKSPKDPQTYVRIARYLVDEHKNRGEQVEPGRGLVPFRYQFSPQAELNYAVQLSDQALSLNNKYVPAMVAKAMALTDLGKSDEADGLFKKALNVAGPNDPEALRLYAEFRSKQAGELLMTAMMLRAPRYETSTHQEWRGDGLWEVKTTYRYDPSPSQLQQAGQMERQAQVLLNEAKSAMEAAVKVSRGALLGYLLEADMNQWFGSRERALELLREAVRKYPGEIKPHDRLVAMYRFLGMHVEAAEEETVGLQLVQTTTAPLLKLAWDRIADRDWAKAKEYLDKSRTLDPVDARWVAYTGVMLAASGDRQAADGYYRLALALEQARLQLDDPTVLTGPTLPRDAMDFALSMRLRLLLADARIKERRLADGLPLLEANVHDGLGFAPGGRAAEMFGAMLPEPGAPRIPIPKPVNGATLLAESYMAAGRIVKSSGRMDEALRHFQAAADLGRPPNYMIPNVGTGRRGETNFAMFATGAAAEAQLELAKVYMAKGDYKTAFDYAQAATQNQPPEHLRKELVEVNNNIARRLNERPTKNRMW